MDNVFIFVMMWSRWWTVSSLAKLKLVKSAVIPLIVCFTSLIPAAVADIKTMTSYSAIVNITYKDPVTGQLKTEMDDMGMYSLASRLDNEYGLVVHVRTSDNRTHGCSPPINVPPKEHWIALVERGQCKFHKKIFNAAVVRNASAVAIYNHEDGGDLLSMQHSVDDVVSIFMKKADGDRIARLVDNGTRVLMRISVGQPIDSQFSGINKTSILFVSISFIVLMIISLAWLVFYYIQRFRYAHAKERLMKRLMNAAKKAINKMPVRTLRQGDAEVDSEYEQCAVCIEPYRVSDVLRELPCKHMFHKSCVDPWLIEQRSCPMCKMDILKAYGLQVAGIPGSCESVVNMELENLSTSGGLNEGQYSVTPPLEAVLYAPAQLELHQEPRQLRHLQPEVIVEQPEECATSLDSDTYERQALMTTILEEDPEETALST